MNLDIIREKLAEKIEKHPEVWNKKLTDTNPGNYGVNYWNVELDYNNIWVDISNRQFSFKNAIFSFDLRMKASKKGGYDDNFSFIAKGQGKFEFYGSEDVNIENVKVDVNLRLYKTL